ncbi:hypothetical protein IWQ61_002639 [Dispira simplex]|nr:hypothetical protein IWQ61_002639 [Dispira simplex]
MALASTGFHNTPLSKALTFGVGAGSIVASIMHWKPYLRMILNPHLTRDYQFWRLATSQLAFYNSGEVLFGCLMLYQFRVIERQFGSKKFSAFIALTAIATKLLELGFLISGNALGLNVLPAGPYGVIFSALYQFYRLIPATYKFRVLSLTFSDKSYMYFLAFQLIALQYPTSLVPALSGLFVGFLYHANLGGIKKWRFPQVFQRWATRWLLPFIASGSTTRGSYATVEQMYGGQVRNQPMSFSNLLTQPQQASTTMGRTYMETMAEGIPQAMSEEEIVALITMFPNVDRATVVRALQRANNDVNGAASILLEG